MEGGSEVDLLSLEDPPPTSGEGEETGDKTSPSLTMESTDESSKIAEQAKEYGQQREVKWVGSLTVSLRGNGYIIIIESSVSTCKSMKQELVLNLSMCFPFSQNLDLPMVHQKVARKTKK